ncbi:MAG TPA: undecaprenyl/decaprenyl-phosphate alpha-N-acetylglucosaminyl 1-phosphate transferase [Anaerolineae bacterium]|nr:undecaprenyl/decaprenyl-phosphate alpha-N-acetylglucosaminyl 1-phosphate transferase [Anaerolineae bacterium]
MATFSFIFLLALSITLLGTPWVRKFALWVGFVDIPAARKMHKNPMPLMGGVAIFLGAMVAILLLAWQDIRPINSPQVQGMALAGTLMACVGLVDDRRGVPARIKLLAQLGGALILIYYGVHVRLPIPQWLNYGVTIVWIAGITNGINFLDNMDGLSAGVSGVAAAFITLLGALNDQFLVAGVSSALLGACLGFLRYNFKPAQIFMGDAGSLFLGFLLSVLALQLRFTNNAVIVTWMVPVYILGIPILDTTLVTFSRLRRGVSPNTPGKDHLSHRLVRLGFSQREAVLIIYLLGGAVGMVAIFLTQATAMEAYGIAGLTALAAMGTIWQLDNISEEVVQ